MQYPAVYQLAVSALIHHEAPISKSDCLGEKFPLFSHDAKTAAKNLFKFLPSRSALMRVWPENLNRCAFAGERLCVETIFVGRLIGLEAPKTWSIGPARQRQLSDTRRKQSSVQKELLHSTLWFPRITCSKVDDLHSVIDYITQYKFCNWITFANAYN